MRPFLAILITATLMGGVYGYIRFAESVRRPPININIDYASGDYSIEVLRTFECVSDPLFGSDALRVLFKGDVVYSTQESIPVEEVVLIEPVPNVEVGENEIYVAANRPDNNLGFDSMQVRVKQNDITIMEKIIPSQPGLTEIGGPVVFNVQPTEPTQAHQH